MIGVSGGKNGHVTVRKKGLRCRRIREKALQVFQLRDDLWVWGSDGCAVEVAAMGNGIAQVTKVLQLFRLALAQQMFVVCAINNPPERI